MLVSIYIVLQLLVIGFFITAFFTKQELLWAITLVMSALMMFSSYQVQVGMYSFNTTLSAYDYKTTTYQYPYMLGFNLMLFGLALVMGFYDIMDKYKGGSLPKWQ